MKPIRFITYTSRMAGEHEQANNYAARQPQAELEKRGIDANTEEYGQRDYSDTILFLVYWCEHDKFYEWFERQAGRGNKIVLLVLDGGIREDVWESWPTLVRWHLLDAVIFPTEAYRKHHENRLAPGAIPTVICTHCDQGYLQPRIYPESFSIGYFGSPFHVSGWRNQFEKVTYHHHWFNREDWIRSMPQFPCHFNIREGIHTYRPPSKMATAAAVYSNLITTRDSGCVEMLGPDYPYYTDCNREAVQKTINYAEETFNSEIWWEGMKMMEEVHRKANLSYEIDHQYIPLFEELSG